jgi:hypothetical protein
MMVMTAMLAAVLLVPMSGFAQTYSRCIDAGGRLYLSDAPSPPGVHCVAQVTRELKETPVSDERRLVLAGHHGLWLTEPSGAMLVRSYPTDAACQAARHVRVAAAQGMPSDIAYRCVPAGSKP